jgi:hypothetical protein
MGDERWEMGDGIQKSRTLHRNIRSIFNTILCHLGFNFTDVVRIIVHRSEFVLVSDESWFCRGRAFTVHSSIPPASPEWADHSSACFSHDSRVL